MKIALTGGGTLGHVYPSLAVAEELKSLDKNVELFYISTKLQNEIEIIENYKIKNYPISSGKLRRYFSLENFKDIFRIIKGFFQAYKILKKERPDVVFSKGGYLTVPVVKAASSLKIKVYTHESDSTLGLATKLNAKVADKVFLGFDLPLVDNKKYFYTGNPVRLDIQKSEKKEFDKPLILVLGGSQGALEINELIADNIEKLTQLGFVYHQTGRKWERKIEKDNYYQTQFIQSDMGALLKSAKLVITRAGAGAISEIMYCKKPMLMLPLGTNVSRGDQIVNAKYIENKGLGLILEDKNELVSIVEKFIKDDDYYKSFIMNYDNINFINPALCIAKHILNWE